MEGHDFRRPMTNTRAELGATDTPAPFRDPSADARPGTVAEDREPIADRPTAVDTVRIPARRDPGAVLDGALARPPTPAEAPGDNTRAGAPPVRQDSPAFGLAPPSRPGPSNANPPADHGDMAGIERGATAPQLRRFIKSRAYVPIHELRRRFGLNGTDDDVTPVDIDRIRVFVGLPDREGRLLGELLRAGDIGYELSMDPISPIVVGVYPMRPVTRG